MLLQRDICMTLAPGFLALAVVTGCGSPPSASRLHDAPTAATTATLVEASNTFGAQLLGNLQSANHGTAGTGMVIAPLSITEALAMLTPGAVGGTQTALIQVLGGSGQSLSGAALAAGYGALARPLAHEPTADGRGLALASRLYAQADMNLLPTYTDQVTQDFAAPLGRVDFVNAPADAAAAINQWVADTTNGRIKDLLKEVTSDTRLIAVNAMTFSARWSQAFGSDLTVNAPFHSGASALVVPMMHRQASYRYGESATLTAVELNYKNDDLAGTCDCALDLILPKDSSATPWASPDFAASMAQVLNALSLHQVDLSLPRFHATQALHLADALRQLGLSAALAPDADFSGITGKRDLALGDVVHQTDVDVTESGTEAGASTAATVFGSSINEPVATFTADHPFIYVLRDRDSGAYLLMGILVDPTTPS